MSLLDLVAAPPRVAASPGTRIAPLWTFDVDAIERACERLRVTNPVRIYCSEYRNGRASGMHTWENGVHRIGVARWATPREANRILWHELVHAHQLERDGEDVFYADPRPRTRSAAYWTDPYEVEARSGEQMADRHPLVK